MKLHKRTWAEIDLDRLKINYEKYRSLIGSETEIMCVVKASCYGHSDRAAAPFLHDTLGVRSYAVSNIDEAIRLREMGITGDILILGYTSPDDADELVKFDIIQTITDLTYAKELDKAAKGLVRCHAAVDTGMTRIGFRGTAENIADEVSAAAQLPHLRIEGAFTHYSSADSLESDDCEYTKAQTDKFFAAAERIKKSVPLKKVHCLNSAGGLLHYDKRSQYARLGIILYGLKPDRALTLPEEIKPVMSLRSTVAQVKEVEAGTAVSYGRTYITDRPTRIATIACGYADGYPRALSNKGEVLIHGVRCPIIGRVCMDQFMCDVTGVNRTNPVRAGDVVTLIGEENGERITADDIAELTGTIGYEVVCSISERVPRAAVENGEVKGVFLL